MIQGSHMNQAARRITPRQQRQEQLLKAAGRRREREQKREQNRARAGNKQVDYAANRKVRRVKADVAYGALMEAKERLAEILGKDVEVIVGRRIDQTQVHSPTIRGGIDYVGRAFDPIEELRLGRKTRDGQEPPKITKQEYNVAKAFRRSFDVMSASLGGAMDFDRVRGGSAGSRALSEAECEASEQMRQISRIAGKAGVDIMESVIGFGHSIEQCAAQRYGVTETMRPRKEDTEHVERSLIEALQAVAAVWYPEPKESATSKSRGDAIKAWSAPSAESSA